MEIKTKKWIDKNFKGNIKNKNVIVTGANSGIGFEFCRDAIYKGANILMAVRSFERGNKARNELLKEFPDANINILHFDASSIASIEEFANEIIKNKIDVDVLFNNAGVFNQEQMIIDNQFERTFLVNYLSNYILLNKLLPYFKSLKHDVKVILQCSLATCISHIDKTDYQSLSHYDKIKGYANSKDYIGKFHYFLSSSNKDSNVKFLLSHPGATYTPLIEKAFKTKTFRILAKGFMKVSFHSPSKASLSAFILLNDNINNGDFYGPRGFLQLSGYPKKTNLCLTKRKKYDEIIEYSKKITNLSF